MIPRSWRAALRRARWLCALMALAGTACAQDFAVLDFPLPADPPTPAGFVAPPEEWHAGTARIELPLMPVSQDVMIYVSVVFRDQPGARLRAKWVGEGRKRFERVLSENLCEGINGWNQRTLQLPYDCIVDPGAFVLEAGAADHAVKRIELVWAYPNVVYSSAAARTIQYVQNSRKGFSEADFADAVKGRRLPDSWSGGIWKAVLQDGAEALDDGIEFSVPMNSSPRAAVFRAKILGAPIDASAVLWVNGEKLSAASLETPELSDPGYLQDYEGRLNYAGWREMAVILPWGLLRKGENSLVLEPAAGVYVKGAMLELKADETAPPGGAAVDFSFPVEEIFQPPLRESRGPAIVTAPPKNPVP